MKHDADDAIARLLRDGVAPGPPVGSCLNAEIVAAWFDGTLTAAGRSEAESHASTCARCQALLAAMAQTEPFAPPPRRTLSLVRWLAPALLAAAAVLVWVNVAHRSAEVPPIPSSVAPAARASTGAAQQTGAPQAAVDQSKPPVPSAKPLEKSAGRAALDEFARESKESRKALSTRADASQTQVRRKEHETGAAAANAPLTANREAQLKDESDRLMQRDALVASPALPPMVRSADGSLWRITGNAAVSRSVDGGRTWREQSLGSSARLLAGSSPSSNVVWFAGGDGVVVVTTDGVSWQWRSLPERVDVTGIAAVDERTATVTARDGRRFVTHDGGLSWVPAPAQENPAAPF